LIKNLVHTLSSRLIVSLFNLALLFITTRWMGAENKGEISLLVLSLSLAAIFSGVFGGPSLVYLIPRYAMRHLLVINYTWSIVTAAMLVMAAQTGLTPVGIGGIDLFVLAGMESIVAMHAMILLGREQVYAQNIVQVIKVSVTVLILSGLKFSEQAVDFHSFINAYGWGLSAALIISLISLRRNHRDSVQQPGLWSTIQAALKYGGLVQIGNLAQLLNYRLSFYFLELLIHPPEKALIRIGIYSAALQVAEALWQFARSVSTVQYSKVANLDSTEEAIRISLTLMKLNAFVTLVGICFLIALPSNVYASLFGQEFSEVGVLVVYLAPGIAALSVSNAFSHFFAGVGLHRINTWSSILGLILTIALGYPSIVNYGVLGAAATASVVYVVQTYFQFWHLQRKFEVAWRDLRLQKHEIEVLKLAWKRIARQGNN
jgi:O-antigen/teichoic acid export membrane protein